jgi:AhpD family alkylhydroperoxidase
VPERAENTEQRRFEAGPRDAGWLPVWKETPMTVSAAFMAFATQAQQFQQPWMAMVTALDKAGALDKRTEELAYLAVLAATGMESGIPFHVQSAVQAGASREEVISAILVGLPAVGQRVISALPAALSVLDAPTSPGEAGQ